MVSTYDEYMDAKKKFFSKHKNDWQVDTQGQSAEYYRKTYTFKDGAVWYEIMTYTTETEKVEIKKCKVNVTVELMRIEYWNTDNGESNYYYEPWKVN